jgi:hypothetical protein
MPTLLMQAARSAAQADGVAPPPPPPDTPTSSSSCGGGNGHSNATVAAALPATGPPPHANATAAGTSSAQLAQRKALQAQQSSNGTSGGGGKKKGLPLRRGKWTPEEEGYANRLIQEFKAGLLPLTDGTTLRTFLSKLLNCDPMRISKKFVGSNCIGKQVFRRRTADLNRLTPEQIQKSRSELSELERRFLERVAQTNRVKNSNATGGGSGGGGVTNNSNAANSGAAASMNLHHAAVMNALNNNAAMNNMMGNNNNMNIKNGMGGLNDFDFGSGNSAAAVMQQMMDNAFQQPSNPPWLQPPLGYEQGMGAQMAAANLAGGGGQHNSRAAAAGRALLGGLSKNGDGSNGGNTNNNNPSASLLAMAALQRRASQQALMNAAAAAASGGSTQNFLAALSGAGGSGNSLAQMAHNASAARLGSLAANGNSFNNLMLKTGFSRDQLSQLARDRGLSSASLSNMVERKSSFDALMSLDFQSLQSIDNLANLIQTGGGSSGVGGFGHAPSSGMKNWSADISNNNQQPPSSASLSNAARHLASATNLESLMRSLSNHNTSSGSGMNQEGGGSANDFVGLSQPSHANLQSLLQNMSNGNMGGGVNNNNNSNNNHHNNISTSMSSLLGANNGSSAASLAHLLRDQSSTGLSALRMQDGLNNRNSSVEDFLSLVAAGDIPHQDPSMLNLSLTQFQQQQLHQQQQQQLQHLQQQQLLLQQNNGSSHGDDAAAMLAHHQQQQQQMLAQATGNKALANALANRSFGSFGGLSHSGPSGNLNSLGSTAALLQQMAGASSNADSFNAMKRKLLDVDGGLDSQESSKR